MKTKKKLYSLIAVLLVAAMFFSFLPNLPAPVVSADENKSSEDLKKELDALESQKAENDAKLAELQNQIQGNYADVESILNEKAAVEQQVQLMYNQIMLVERQIITYSDLIAKKQDELDAANKRYNELNAAYKKRIRAMEEAGDLSYWSVLFKANSFSDFLDRLNMITEIANADQRRLTELKAAAEQVEAARQELKDGKAKQEKVRAELLEKQAEMDKKSAQADVVLQALIEKAKEDESLHDEFERLEQEFLDQIADKKDEYDTQVKIEESIKVSSKEASAASSLASKKASQQASKVQSSILASKHQSTAPTGGGNSNVGADNPSGVTWLVPCTYTRVTSPFGYRWHPTTGEWSMHKGVDLGAYKGTPIYATRSGKVTVATYHTTAGNYVTIDHGDTYRSTYMHMTHYVVAKGDYVKAGQLIGYVGSTGRSTGPHLHFGIMYGYSSMPYVDPMKYIG